MQPLFDLKPRPAPRTEGYRAMTRMPSPLPSPSTPLSPTLSSYDAQTVQIPLSRFNCMQHSVANIFPNQQQSQQSGFRSRETRVTFAPPPSPFIIQSASSPVYNDDQNAMLTPFFPNAFNSDANSYGGAQLPYYHQSPQPQAYAGAPPPESSPQTEMIDTPRTLYKMSPQTEAGDEDVDGDYSDDEDVVVRHRSADQSLNEQAGDKGRNVGDNPLAFALASTSPKSYTLGDLVDKGDAKPSKNQIRQFASRLQIDIESASLFPGVPSAPLVAIAPPPQQLPPPPTQTYHPLAAVQQASPSADVIAPLSVASHSLNSNLPAPAPNRQIVAPMPIRQPLQVIDPHQVFRHSSWATQAVPKLQPHHLVRFQWQAQPQQCVRMSDLFVKDAVWHCGPPPDEAAKLLLSPPQMDDEDADGEFEFDESFQPFAFEPKAEDVVMAAPVVPSQPRQVQTPAPTPTPQPIRKTRTGATKRSAPQDDDPDYEDSDDDAIGEDDDEYKAPTYTRAAIAQVSEQPVKRRRLSETASRDSLSPPPPELPTSPRQPTTRGTGRTARGQRHKDDHPRENGCLHGCDATFGTTYEVRRHQEDAHARAEAYSLANKSTTDALYPRDFRFLIPVMIHAYVNTWSTAQKAAFQNAMKKEDVAMDPNLVAAMHKWAATWRSKYECETCGASFSRMDSKKRHGEKQCKNK